MFVYPDQIYFFVIFRRCIHQPCAFVSLVHLFLQDLQAWVEGIGCLYKVVITKHLCSAYTARSWADLRAHAPPRDRRAPFPLVTANLRRGTCKPAKGNLQTCEGEPANLRRGTCKPAKEPPSFATSVGVLNGQTDPPRINRYKGQVEHCKVLQ